MEVLNLLKVKTSMVVGINKPLSNNNINNRHHNLHSTSNSSLLRQANNDKETRDGILTTKVAKIKTMEVVVSMIISNRTHTQTNNNNMVVMVISNQFSQELEKKE